jgi:hypothetical protein
MPRRYTMRESVDVSRLAARHIEAWLTARPRVLHVQKVEAEPTYQRLDIDLIVVTTSGRYSVEIKGDRWHQTGNFFFETNSNQEKGTVGCFLLTAADYLFYYFVEPRWLYILPMPATRLWFEAARERFPARATTTSAGRGAHYTTVGRLTPVAVVMAEVPGARHFQL